MKQTIVMIHGMCSTNSHWANYKQFFEDHGYRCVTPVLRFHDMHPDAEPDPALGTTGLLDYTEDLEKEIKQIDDTPILMGHSMGGLLAQILTTKIPVKALVLLTPASPAGIMALKYSVIKTFSDIMFKWKFWKKPFLFSLKTMKYGVINLLPPDEQEKIYRTFVYESGLAGFQIGFWTFDFSGAAKVDKKKITCPVLVIGAQKDKITPVSVVKKVAKRYKTVSTYKEFSDHAHWVLSEPGWEDITGYIASWLNDNV
ncbi:MAG: alpha/beta hydrolase [Proteobacteria bacterium]|nr:alpha/beta hydrolase [Pseudomonadota bacterium]